MTKLSVLSLTKQELLLILGFSTFWIWTDLCFYGNAFTSFTAKTQVNPLILQIIGVAAMALSSGIVVVWPHKMKELLESRSIRIVLFTAIAIVTLMVPFSYGWLGLAAFVVFQSSVSLLAGLSIYVWVDQIAGTRLLFGPGILIAGAITCGGAVVLAASLLCPEAELFVAVVQPLIGLILFEQISQKTKEDKSAAMQTERSHDPDEKALASHHGKTGLSWRFLVGLAVFSIAAGSSQLFTTSLDSGEIPLGMQAEFLARYITAAVVFVGACVFSWKPYPMFCVASLVTVGGFLALPFLPEHLRYIAPLLANAGYTCLELMVWGVLFEAARAQDRLAISTVASGRLIMASMAFIGVLVGASSGIWASGRDPMSAIASVIAYAIIAVTVLVLDESRQKGSWHLAENSFANLEPKSDRITRCKELSNEYGLTQREREVLILLSEGRSVPFIAGELGVAPSTITFHVRHIYDKLGVRSKNAIIDLVRSHDRPKPPCEL